MLLTTVSLILSVVTGIEQVLNNYSVNQSAKSMASGLYDSLWNGEWGSIV